MTKKKTPAKKKRATKSRVTGEGRGGGKTTQRSSVLTKKDEAAKSVRGLGNRKIRQEDMRERITGMNVLTGIENDVAELVEISNKVKGLKPIIEIRETKKGLKAVVLNDFELAKADTHNRVLKTRLETRFKLLAKIVPDLKSIEVTDSDGNNIFEAFLDAVKENQGEK